MTALNPPKDFVYHKIIEYIYKNGGCTKHKFKKLRETRKIIDNK